MVDELPEDQLNEIIRSVDEDQWVLRMSRRRSRALVLPRAFGAVGVLWSTGLSWPGNWVPFFLLGGSCGDRLLGRGSPFSLGARRETPRGAVARLRHVVQARVVFLSISIT